MNAYLRPWKHYAGLFVLSLMLALGQGSAALAAPTASFSATAKGPVSNLTLTATINAADADLGQSGVTYLGVNFNNLWFFNNSSAWVQYLGGAAPVYAAGPIASRTFDVVRNADVSTLVGAKVYVGYGLSESDMLAKGKFAMVYTIGSETTAPLVSVTGIANGAFGVPVNTTVGATFSEAMDSTTITTANFTLLQGTTPVIGTISYVGVNAVFTPAASLAHSTLYTATIKGGVKDLAGNVMGTDYVWSFTTGAAPDTTAPTVNSQAPVANAMGVAGNTVVTATFSEAMDPLTITSATMQLACPAGASITGSVSFSSSNNVATFAPASNLPAGTQCTATIRTGAKDLAGNALASDFVWTFFTADALPLGPSRVNLGTAGNYAILAKTAVSTVPASVITGDVGVSPAATSYLTGFSLTMVGTTSATSPQVTGNLYGADMTTPTSSNLTTAVLDMQAAYTDAAGRSTPDFLNLNSGNIGGLTLAPGLYNWGSSVTVPADVTISGGANDVWIFQMSGDLSVSATKRITLVGGAQAKNIFWQVAGQVTVGANAQFEGNMLSKTAILLMTGSNMNGRALAQTQVALQSATVTKPAQ